MTTLSLVPLAEIATRFCGEPVAVEWADLSAEGCLGRASRRGGEQLIELDHSLATWRSREFNRTYLHELGHVWCLHVGSVAATRQIEAEADAIADELERRGFAGLPWALAHSDMRYNASEYQLPKFYAEADAINRQAARGRAAPAQQRTAADQWAHYQREFAAELRDPALWDLLPEPCAASIARAKRAAGAALNERERRAVSYTEPVRVWSVAAQYSVR